MITCLLIVALPAEARPLIDHFRLKRKDIAGPGGAYRCYCNDKLALVETGLGKLNAAGATAAVLSVLHQAQGLAPACLNVGLAGAALPLGQLVAAHSVVDQATGKNWFPQLTWAPASAKRAAAASLSSDNDDDTIIVTTVDIPNTGYRTGHAFDMEASGIYASATRFTTLEFIQCLKIVSDNADNPVEAIDKSLATELIAPHCGAIEHATAQLAELHARLPETQRSKQMAQSLCDRLHFTTTQRSSLVSLLRQHQARFGSLPTEQLMASHPDAKALLAYLVSTFTAVPVTYK